MRRQALWILREGYLLLRGVQEVWRDVLQVLRYDEVSLHPYRCLRRFDPSNSSLHFLRRFDIDGDTVFCFDCDRDHPPLTSNHPDTMDIS